MALYRQGFPLHKFRDMATRGSFGQKDGERNPHIITVEHMTPLITGDNFLQNFALATSGANYDFNKLVLYQTDFLEPDRVSYRGGEILWESVAHTVNIVALRPPFLSYGKGKRFPAFIRHPGWDWHKG